ncbi:sodium:solute symporter family transporter [Candidatus Jidaibacter acanthamoebae]|nr:ATP-binding protein [Candidatus Jidaibacter acanthamoeba]
MQYFDIDKTIVLIFLMATLVIGIIAGKDLKNIREYAIANKSFGTPVLLITLLATMVGGGSTTGDVAQIFEDGIVYLLAMIGPIISALIMAYYIAPKFDGRFDGMISASDLIKYFYGVKAEKFSGIAGFIACTTLLAMQLIALGHLAANILNINYTYGVLITSGLIIAYSTFGGIKSITVTAILQFAMLIIMVPIIANVATNQVGGLGKVFSGIGTEPHMQIINHPKFYEYLLLGLFFSLPFSLFFPSIIQRFLMAQNNKQIAHITYAYAVLQIAMVFMVICIGLSTLKLYPSTEPRVLIPSLINDYLPPLIKGLAISGMIAVLMSTADSFLNSAGILIAHNVMPQKALKTELGKLNFMKLCTLTAGLLAMMIAMRNYNIISILTLSCSLILSIFGIPLFFGILGYRVLKSSFWLCSICSIIASIVANSLNMGSAIPIFTAALGFLGYIIPLFILKQGLTKVLSNTESPKQVSTVTYEKMIKMIVKHLPTPKNIYRYSKTKVENFGANHLMFGIFCCVNYIVPYFMWTHQKPLNYFVMLSLRLIAGLLCVGLLFKEYWPKRFKKYFPLYWHLTLMYCLPFVTTVMFIVMSADVEWLINLTLAIMLLAMLVDWTSFIIIFLTGVLLGYLFYEAAIGAPIPQVDFDTVYLSIYVCVFATLIGLLFARRKEIDTEEKLEVMRFFGGAMAHEVKTPLAAIDMCAQHIDITLSRMISTLESGSSGNSVLKECSELKDLALTLRKISSQGINTVGNLLMSLKSSVIAEDKNEYYLIDCIDHVLVEFGREFAKLENIDVNIPCNFKFYGSMHYMEQVFQNLFNNAYKYGGENVNIKIWTEDNKLIFEDNGRGIPSQDLPYIFDRFYTKSKDGTGIGLAFCRMVMEDMEGGIYCKSELNKYTQFTLEFPKKLKNEELKEEEKSILVTAG